MTDDLPDHTNYSLIKAVDESGNLVTVLADSSGRIVSVMKGDYAGTMKTLAVDSQGRIQAVLTDPEDVFGNPNYIGAGELAARLGSIKSFEKRGEVVFMDDFEDATLKWEVAGFGTGHSEARSNESARSGNYSMKLTTGDEVDNVARMTRYYYVPKLKRLGVEVSFALSSSLKRLQIFAHTYEGTTRYAPVVRYYPQTNDLTIDDENGAERTIDTDLDLYEKDSLFHTLKFVFDLDAVAYVRMFVDSFEYDLSAYGVYSTTSALGPYCFTEIEVKNNASGNHYAYIDDFILTQNEP